MILARFSRGKTSTEPKMRFFRIFRKARAAGGRAFDERKRLEKAMPGETGALAALRLGLLVH